MLLDLSGNEAAARLWAATRFAEIQTVNKADLKWLSKPQALAVLRRRAPQNIAFFTADLPYQSARSSMLLFAALTGARRILFADSHGRLIERSRFGAFTREAPRLLAELLFGYLFLLPLTWLLTWLLAGMLWFRAALRRIQKHQARRAGNNSQAMTSQTALYLRATLTGAKEGGMVSHVAGFASGAASLGHRLQFLVSGNPLRENPNDAVADSRLSSAAATGSATTAPPQTLNTATHLIAPSASFSATRALFELWNNLVFTAKSLAWLKRARLRSAPASRFAFIYQRYNRFNWTGAALSVLSGLPLALEFNGSEVWISQRWDPVGQLGLLKRFESLNLRAADFIFTVSEVERHNLIAAGVAADKIITNPNGVDVEKFRPACGGAAVRSALELEEKIVVGFLGTFGPWHGAPRLAQAALRTNAFCHFLFIGDGDERAACEATLAAQPGRATFVGRLPHERVAAYLDACDILASPHVAAADGSEFFGSPTKLFEYLAMQKPVVASRLGQIADVIVDGENGLLVEPGDVEALARALDTLAADATLRERLGQAARQRVTARFTWRHNAARVFERIGSRE